MKSFEKKRKDLRLGLGGECHPLESYMKISYIDNMRFS